MSRSFSFPYKRFFNDYYPIIKINFQSPNGLTELGSSINLLGQKDIFESFKITFDTRGKRVIFLPY